MNYRFDIDVTIEFGLDDQEFEFITDAIKSNGETKGHAEVGGFWYGNMNRQRFKSEKESDIPCLLATTRQMDTVVLKSIELYRSINREMSNRLFGKLFKILKHAMSQRQILNTNERVREA